MPSELKSNCLFCNGKIAPSHPVPDAQRKVLADWKGQCLDSLMQFFHLPSSLKRSIQKSSFCASCFKIVRDMNFLLHGLERFQERLQSLKETAGKILFNNAEGLEDEANIYSMTVKTIVECLEGSYEEDHKFIIPMPNYPSYAAEDPLSLRDQLTETEILENTEFDSSGSRSKRMRVSRNADVVENNWTSVVKEEPDDEGGTAVGDDCDPDFDPDSADDFVATGRNRKRRAEGRNPKQKNDIKEGKGIKEPKPKLWCTFPGCSVVKFAPSALQAHIRKDHEGDPNPWHCTKCPMQFRIHGALWCHNERLHSEGKLANAPLRYPCTLCDMQFRGRPALAAHCVTVHGLERDPTPYLCKLCPLQFRIPSSLWCHVKRSHGPGSNPTLLLPSDDSISGPGEQQQSGSEGRRNSSNKHAKEGNGVRKFPARANKPKLWCTFPGCSVRKFVPAALRAHIQMDHEGDPTPWHCTKCPMKFRIHSALWSHTKRSHGPESSRMSSNNVTSGQGPSEKPKGGTVSRQNAKDGKRNRNLEGGAKKPELWCTIPGCSVRKFVPAALQAHIQKDHEGDPNPWHCTKCPMRFRIQSSLWGHNERRHAEGSGSSVLRYGCTACDLRFRYRPALAAHSQSVHGVESWDGSYSINLPSYDCDLCPATFNQPKRLERHKSREHQVTLSKKATCPLCSKEYPSRVHLRFHMANVHLPQKLKPKCSVCSRTFETEEEVKAHEELHAARRTTEYPFSCVFCDKLCPNSLDLQAHVKSEHEEGMFRCLDCNGAFYTRSRLNRHKKLRHNVVQRLDLTCPTCSYQSTAPSALRKHMVKHMKVSAVEFKCDRPGCTKTFKYRSTLNRHISVDHDLNPGKLFKCSLCARAFNQSSKLACHQAHHSSTRPFLCDHCSMSFKTLQNLRTHMKVHEGNGLLPGRRVPSLQRPRKSRLQPVFNTDPSDNTPQ